MRILIVVHGFPPHARGGSEIYAEAQACALRDRFGDEVLVLTREADPSRPEYAVRRTEHRGVAVAWVNNTFRRSRSFDDSYTNPALAATAADLIAAFSPDVAHVHHLTCLSTLIPEQLARDGIPCVMTLHDYWLLCHRGQLLDLDCRMCGQPGTCSRCVDPAVAAADRLGRAAPALRQLAAAVPAAPLRVLRAVASRTSRSVASPDAAAAAARRRLAHMRHATRDVARFFAPSRHLRDRFVAAGFDAARIEHWPYGVGSPAEARRPFAAGASHRGRVLRVGFVGSLMVSKAPDLLLRAVARLPPGTARVELFGAFSPYHGDHTYATVLDRALASAPATSHGWLPHDELRCALSRIDVLAVPSIWPENSPLVIHEALLAGVPVVAARIGGIPELIAHERNGLLVAPGDAAALGDALLRLIVEPGLLDRLASVRTPIRSLDDDVAATRAAYLQLVPTSPARATTPVNAVHHHELASRDDLPGVAVHAVVLNYHTPEATLLAVRSLMASDLPMAGITVVDNSADVSAGRALRTVADHVHYLSTGMNLGFPGGMNIGIRRALAAGATHVLIVNSDMTIPPDCPATLLRALACTPGAGIAGPLVLARSEPDRIASGGLDYHQTTGRMRHRHFRRPLSSVADEEGPVDSVSGCLMLVDRRVFDRIGLFDEAYFFGFEDLDFCLRARRHGYATLLTPAVAYHEGAQSLATADPSRLYYAARNHLRLAQRLGTGGAAVRRLRSAAIIGLNAAFALRASPGEVPSRLAAVLRGVRHYRAGRFGPR